MAKTYTPVGWQDGEIVTPAKADLTTGIVTPAEVNGTTPVNAENLRHMDDAIKQLYDEGTTSKDIVIGTEEDATEDTKILIEDDFLNCLGTEVVDSLEGNEKTKSPSVQAVNSAIGQIIESGSNDNGNYIKYSDGTMICRGTVIIPITTISWGNIYACDWSGSIAFPIAFIEKPTIIANSVSNAGIIAKIIASATSIIAITVTRGTTISNTNYPIDFIAIGRWK